MKLTSQGQAGARNEEQREKKDLEGSHRGRKLEDVCREFAVGKRGKWDEKMIESVNERREWRTTRRTDDERKELKDILKKKCRQS